MSELTYQRVPLNQTLFLYAAHFQGANYVQIGIGSESINGLQMTHISSDNIHHFHVHEEAERIVKEGYHFKTGKLAPYFNDAPDVEVEAGMTLARRLGEIMKKVHDDVWGEPYEWEPIVAELNDKRLIWAAYDAVVSKIKIGIGFIDDHGQQVFGPPSFAVGRGFVAEFVKNRWIGRKPLIFFAKPPRWPCESSNYLGEQGSKAVAKMVVALSDRIWPGELPETD